MKQCHCLCSKRMSDVNEFAQSWVVDLKCLFAFRDALHSPNLFRAGIQLL